MSTTAVLPRRCCRPPVIEKLRNEKAGMLLPAFVCSIVVDAWLQPVLLSKCCKRLDTRRVVVRLF